MIVKIPFAKIHAFSSDFLAGTVKIVFQLSLNDETMKLRDQVSMLKSLDQYVALDIVSPQKELLPDDGGFNSTQDTLPSADKVFDTMAAQKENANESQN